MDKSQAIDAIIDAAIHVFAQWGYEGASLRAIASAADLPLSTIDNYFGSKGQLYRSLIRTVWEEVTDERRLALEARRQDNGAVPLRLEQVIEALAEPIIRRLMGSESASRDQLYFLQQRYREHRALNAIDDLDSVDSQVRPMIEALISTSPGMTFDDGVWAFSYCVGVMYSMQLMDRRYENLLSATHRQSEDEVLFDVVAFCSAGVRAMLARRINEET